MNSSCIRFVKMKLCHAHLPEPSVSPFVDCSEYRNGELNCSTNSVSFKGYNAHVTFLKLKFYFAHLRNIRTPNIVAIDLDFLQILVCDAVGQNYFSMAITRNGKKRALIPFQLLSMGSHSLQELR
jgi:hypothetical protein